LWWGAVPLTSAITRHLRIREHQTDAQFGKGINQRGLALGRLERNFRNSSSLIDELFFFFDCYRL
jgi:hypothetical protein